ncbi:MAG: Rap1a/Tai family immunity protein [Betaproteobacteria bacterium]
MIVAGLLLTALLGFSGLALAEDDGEEFLGMMDQPASREAASAFINDVRARWDGSLFCLARGTAQGPENSEDAAFDAVKTYLQNHPEDRFRPRRYLIVQGLRAAFPCAGR